MQVLVTQTTLRVVGCLGEQLQADCGTDLISTGLVALRAFQELFIRQQGFQEGRWEILVWEFLKVLNETQYF